MNFANPTPTIPAALTAAAGIGRGDRIAVIVPNQIEWLFAFFAVAGLGAVVVGMSVRYRDTERANCGSRDWA